MATPIPANLAPFSLTEIARTTGAEMRVGTHSEITGITTDSRADVTGKLFVALKGESFDGHRFVADVARAGAHAVLVSDDVEVPSDVSVVRVRDTLAALGALARQHRRRWGGELVAVAGSAGKTTTKTAIAAALSAAGTVHSSAGNLNNLVGVPMVLLGLTDEHRFGVVEIGTNQKGEVKKLAAMAEADVAVLTLIAIEHSEGLGDLDEVAEEEAEILRQLGAASTAIGNADDARVHAVLDASPAGTKLTYGTRESADYRVLERTSPKLGRSRLVIERPNVGTVTIETSLCGIPGSLAVAAALAVADRLHGSPVDLSVVERALDRIGAGEPGRLNPIRLGDDSVVIDDTYNANPASVESSVALAAEIARSENGRLVLVIGEMRELGALSVREHASLGTALARSGAAFCVAVAGDAEHLANSARNAGLDAWFAKDADAALKLLEPRLRPRDVILVKASRGVKSERIVDALIAAKGRAA
jgi:UDP-N-acetylmuramoyl-tripeptide--D-alanyl-D-alanine ligase